MCTRGVFSFAIGFVLLISIVLSPAIGESALQADVAKFVKRTLPLEDTAVSQSYQKSSKPKRQFSLQNEPELRHNICRPRRIIGRDDYTYR
jgi:hypothetical protein